MAFGETNIPFWQESGHSCRECTVTGLRFWSRDPSRTTSGDTVEDSYTFIANPIIEGFSMRGKALKDAMRETFLDYFEQRGHTSCLLYTSPSPRDRTRSRMPSSA